MLMLICHRGHLGLVLRNKNMTPEVVVFEIGLCPVLPLLYDCVCAADVHRIAQPVAVPQFLPVTPVPALR